MNPALLLVLILLGTALLVLGTIAAVFGWLDRAPALVIAAIGATIETPAAVAFARSRRVSKAGPRR